MVNTLHLIIGLALVFLILALTPDKTPPHWSKVCVKEDSTLFPMSTGNGLMLIPDTQCVKYEVQCVAGKDFKGTRTCSGPKPAEVE